VGGPQSMSGRRGEEKILPLQKLELRPLGRPARSQSLYGLSYPGSPYALMVCREMNVSVCRQCFYGNIQL
jgi:hypothetical protein